MHAYATATAALLLLGCSGTREPSSNPTSTAGARVETATAGARHGTATATPGEVAAATRSETAAPAAPAVVPAPEDWAGRFGRRSGCFAVFDRGRNAWMMHGGARCEQRFRPFSTFKIPHVLIGLDSGAVTGPDEVIAWDRTRYPARDWWPANWRDRHDLASAFRHSVVPYFQSMARRIGEKTMADYLNRFDYGNRDISGDVDRFWLSGRLGISAVEQIAFLRALHEERLLLSSRTMTMAKELFVHERGRDYVMRAKTGTGEQPDGSVLGWFVGYVECRDNVVYFALNISGRAYSEIPRQERMAMSKAMLATSGACCAGSAEPESSCLLGLGH